jgi:hypothetical protein
MSDVVYIDIVSDLATYDVLEDVIEFIELGIQGPAGPQGDTGPMGPVGAEEVPTFPIVDPKSSTNLGAGTSVNIDSVAVSGTKTGKVQQITLSSSAPVKWEIKKSSLGVDTTMDVVFTSGNTGNSPTHEWEPPHRDYTQLVGNGTSAFFRVTATNLDASHAANVYATFYFDEVDGL